MEKIMNLKKWRWALLLVSVLGIWYVLLCFFGKSGRAVIIFEDCVLSNGPYCGTKVYVMNDGTCTYEYQEDGSKSEGVTKYVVNEEEHSISISYDHPLGRQYVTFSFDMEHEEYDCSRYCGVSGFELFEVHKVNWSRVPSLFKE